VAAKTQGNKSAETKAKEPDVETKPKGQDSGDPGPRNLVLDKTEVERFEHVFVIAVAKGVTTDVDEFLSGSVDNANIVATVQNALNAGFRFDSPPTRLDTEDDGRGSLRVTYGGPVHSSTEPEPGKDPAPRSVIEDMGGTTIETEDAETVRAEFERKDA